MTRERIIVLRHGETFIKGANRGFFEKLLLDNTKRALRGVEARVERDQGRFFVRCSDHALAGAMRRLRRVFGFSSISPAQLVERDIEAMGAVAVELMETILDERDVESFRVRTQRSDKSFPLPSPEVSRLVGAAVYQRCSLPVRLKGADVVIGVEIGRKHTFVFAERVPGAGGLPVGASGRVLLLLSGGIDSPVAGHLMQKRGCLISAVYFHAPPHTGERAKDKVIRLAEEVAAGQGPLQLFVVRFTELQQRLRDQGPKELAVVLYRRAMMRIASRLAAQHDLGALVTGENLGQVASQTLENLRCIEDAATLPVLRPLLAFDKREIIDLAQRIGSYETSILPHEDTCSLFVPKHPATRAKLERVQEAEAPIELDDLIDTAVATAERIVCEGRR